MADVSESPGEAHQISETTLKAEEPESDFDPKTMRKSKPGIKRLVLTLSALFSFLLGFPFLWKSVEIYRAPLPFREIDTLSAQIELNPLLFPCHFHAIFVGFDSKPSMTPDALESSIINQMSKLTSKPSQCGTCSTNYSISVTIDSSSGCLQTQNLEYTSSWRCGSMGTIDFVDDEGVDKVLADSLGGKVYSVVVVVNGDSEEVRTVVGKYRHAWVVGGVSEAEAVVRAAEIFAKVFVNGGKEEGLIHGEFMPVGADGKIVLSFNLLNSDPQDWVYDWDFQSIDETLLAPVIEALESIANISVESQVLYHTPKSSFSRWDDEQESYIFSTKNLPFFVNSNEWHLDTSIAAGGRSKILQFVVYIPSARECPLLLQLPNGEISKTNGFISLMWGGVLVWNPKDCLKDSESQHPPRHIISQQDLQEVFEVVMGQFRQLFGLKSKNDYVGVSGTSSLLASERGFTEWELDVLSRQHACFNLHSCATTLGSLSRLVQSLPRMIIMDEIGKQVMYSLEAANLARINASVGLYDASAVSSRQARSLAEDAFFHPSIMSVSYYSFEHCFAVYSLTCTLIKITDKYQEALRFLPPFAQPFFLPVSMHVLLAALREWRRYKQESNKYLTWKTKVKKD